MAKPNQIVSLRLLEEKPAFITKIYGSYSPAQYTSYAAMPDTIGEYVKAPDSQSEIFEVPVYGGSIFCYRVKYTIPNIPSTAGQVRVYTWDHNGLGTDYHAVNIYAEPFNGLQWYGTNDKVHIWSTLPNGWAGLRTTLKVTTVRNVGGDWYTADGESDPVQLIEHFAPSEISITPNKLESGLKLTFGHATTKRTSSLISKASVFSSGILNPAAAVEESILSPYAVLAPVEKYYQASTTYRNKTFIDAAGDRYDYYKLKDNGTPSFVGLDLGEGVKAQIHSVTIDSAATKSTVADLSYPTKITIERSDDGITWEAIESSIVVTAAISTFNVYTSIPKRFFRVIVAEGSNVWHIRNIKFELGYSTTTYQCVTKSVLNRGYNGPVIMDTDVTNCSVTLPESMIGSAFVLAGKVYNDTESSDIAQQTIIGYSKPPRPTGLTLVKNELVDNAASITINCQPQSQDVIEASFNGCGGTEGVFNASNPKWNNLSKNTWYDLRVRSKTTESYSDPVRLQVRTMAGAPSISTQAGTLPDTFSVKVSLETKTQTPDIKNGSVIGDCYYPGTTNVVDKAPFVELYSTDLVDMCGPSMPTYIKKADGDLVNFYEVPVVNNEAIVGYHFASLVNVSAVYIDSSAYIKELNGASVVMHTMKPQSAKVQYSIDGTNWLDAAGEFDLTDKMTVVLDTVAKAAYWRVKSTVLSNGMDYWRIVRLRFDYTTEAYEMNKARAYDGNVLKKVYSVVNQTITIPVDDIALFPNGMAIELYDEYTSSLKSNVLVLNMPTNLKVMDVTTTDATISWVYKTGTENFKLYSDSGATITVTPSDSTLTSDQKVLKVKSPVSVTLDSDKNLYVYSAYNGQIYVYSKAGVLLRTFGGLGTGDGKFLSVKKILTDSSRNLYALDMEDHFVKKFDSEGVYVKRFGGKGLEDEKLNSPTHMHIYDNKIYIADAGNKKLKIFDTNGTFIDAISVGYNARITAQFGPFVWGHPYGYGKDLVVMEQLKSEGFNPSYRYSQTISVNYGRDTYTDIPWWNNSTTTGKHVVDISLSNTANSVPRLVVSKDQKIKVICEQGFPQIKLPTLPIINIDDIKQGKANLISTTGSGTPLSYEESLVATDVCVSNEGVVFSCDETSNKAGLGYYPTTAIATGWNMTQFKSPKGVAIDEDGNMFIADFGNDRVMCFNKNGALISVFGEDANLPDGSSSYSYTILGLTPGSAYKYRVSAIEGGLETGKSPEIQVNTLFEPVIVERSAVTTVSADVIWVDPNGDNIEGYKFYLDTAVNPVGIKPKDASNAYTVNGLEPNKSYKISMKAYTSATESELSNSVTALTKPVPPTGLRATRLRQDTARIMWNEVKGAVKYTLSVDNVEKDTIINSMDVTGLIETATYAIKVKCTNESGESEYSAVLSFNISTIPTSPMTVKLDEATDTTLKVVFDPVADFDHYEVWVDGVCEINNLAVTEYTIENKTPGRVYKVQIKGYDTYGSEFLSYVLGCKTFARPVFNAELNTVPNPVTSNSANIKWDAVAGAAKYKINVNSELKAEVTNYDNVIGLAAGKKYIVEVQACDAADTIISSDTLSIRTLLQAPTGLFTIPSEITSTSIILRWTYNGGDDAVEGFKLMVNGVLHSTFNKGMDMFKLIDGLTADTNYTIALIATGTGVADSAQSTEITVKTSA